MVEKYGLRADRNATNPEHVIISHEEIQGNLFQKFIDGKRTQFR